MEIFLTVKSLTTNTDVILFPTESTLENVQYIVTCFKKLEALLF